MDYQAAYKILFNAITDALAELEGNRIVSKELKKAQDILIHAQQATEDMYLASDSPSLQ